MLSKQFIEKSKMGTSHITKALKEIVTSKQSNEIKSNSFSRNSCIQYVTSYTDMNKNLSDKSSAAKILAKHMEFTHKQRQLQPKTENGFIHFENIESIYVWKNKQTKQIVNELTSEQIHLIEEYCRPGGSLLNERLRNKNDNLNEKSIKTL